MYGLVDGFVAGYVLGLVVLQCLPYGLVEGDFFGVCKEDLRAWGVAFGFACCLHAEMGLVAQEGVANGKAVAGVLVDQPDELVFVGFVAAVLEVGQVDLAVACEALPG